MKVTQGVAGMNAKGKGSSYGGMKVVEDGRKRKHGDFPGSLKEKKRQEEGLEQSRVKVVGEKGMKEEHCTILHHPPGTVLTDEIPIPHRYTGFC